MQLKEMINEVEVLLLDMDGTIYLEDTPIGDMKNTLSFLREKGKKLVYFTNNSSRTEKEYVEKLKKIGFWDERDFVYTSAMATAEYLNEFYPQKKVFVLGTDSVKQEFASRGVRLEEKNPEVCVLAYDTTLTFPKMVFFNECLAKGMPYLATHPDDVCPAKGVYPPDVGSFIALFKVSSGRLPDAICGKPFTVMGDCLMRRFQMERNKFLMVGDRLHTDIRFGVNNSFHTLLVMSGETTEEIKNSSPDKAEFVLPSLNEIVNYF